MHFVHRFSPLLLLTAMALTSMPMRCGIFGECPCGCMPEALKASESADPEGENDRPRGDHHDDHHGCHCQCPVPYGPTPVGADALIVESASLLHPEPEQILPANRFTLLIRPPRG